MRETVVRISGLTITVVYAVLIGWLYARQPATIAEVTGGLSAAIGAYHVDQQAFEDGLQVINVMDPTNPYTVGYYDTYDKPHATGKLGAGLFGGMPGAFGIDVRNADGLIVISDMITGFWAFHMDGFDGWNGHQWGMPNVSSAQDWDNGPEGAPKTTKTS